CEGRLGMPYKGSAVDYQIYIYRQEDCVVPEKRPESHDFCFKFSINFEDEQRKQQHSRVADKRYSEMRRENEIILSPHYCCSTNQSLCEDEADAEHDEEFCFPFVRNHFQNHVAQNPDQYDCDA